MKIKIIALITSCLFIVASIIGLITKNNYSNINLEETTLLNFHVALASEKTIEPQCEFILESIYSENSNTYIEEDFQVNIILRVEPIEDMDFIFMDTIQEVKVLEVYKGDNIIEGDVIKITSSSGSISLNYDRTSEYINIVNMGFINELEIGEEYLVLLNGKVKTIDQKIVYEAPSFLVTPFFSYSDTENSLPELENNSDSYVAYSKVSQNEFFVQNENALNMLNELKTELIQMFPN